MKMFKCYRIMRNGRPTVISRDTLSEAMKLVEQHAGESDTYTYSPVYEEVEHPYLMVFNTEDCTDGIEFESLEAAKGDAMDTLLGWAFETLDDNNIMSLDLSTWSEEAKEDWDIMIYNCYVEVRVYNPKTGEYDETVWEPSYEDEERLGWIPTDEVEKWNRYHGIGKGANE